MTAVWQAILQSAWRDLSRGNDNNQRFRSRRLSSYLFFEVYAAIRALDNAPCVITPVYAPPSSLFEMSGMRLNNIRFDDGPLLVLSLEDAAGYDIFVIICADAIATAAEFPTREALPRFLARLDAWLQFTKGRC